MRLGSYYRSVLAPYLGLKPTGCRVLEVGAADAQLLQRLSPARGVALDVSSGDAGKAPFVLGDGTRAPFRSGCFDTVYALDVLEHVAEDAALMRELLRVTKPAGVLWISVPSSDYAAFPPFLTGFLHRRWGHLRPGYRLQALLALVPQGVEVRVLEWNEPFYRLAYAPLWALSRVLPGAARSALRLVAWLDHAFCSGHRGHYFLRLSIPGACLPGRQAPGG